MKTVVLQAWVTPAAELWKGGHGGGAAVVAPLRRLSMALSLQLCWD